MRASCCASPTTYLKSCPRISAASFAQASSILMLAVSDANIFFWQRERPVSPRSSLTKLVSTPREGSCVKKVPCFLTNISLR